MSAMPWPSLTAKAFLFKILAMLGNWKERAKNFSESERGKTIYLILIIFFTALTAFGLGRISRFDSAGPPAVVIERGVMEISDNLSSLVSTTPNGVSQGQQSEKGSYVASKRGKKYYPANCSAAKSLKPENLIYFQTAAAAEAAGYTPSSSC